MHDAPGKPQQHEQLEAYLPAHICLLTTFTVCTLAITVTISLVSTRVSDVSVAYQIPRAIPETAAIRTLHKHHLHNLLGAPVLYIRVVLGFIPC
jgi:hypothetical protein